MRGNKATNHSFEWKHFTTPFGQEVIMKKGFRIKTFVLAFHAIEFCAECHGDNYTPMESHIQETIDNYCKQNSAIEIDRKITTSFAEGNGVLLVYVTSRFIDR
jgi:hypothetical protein